MKTLVTLTVVSSFITAYIYGFIQRNAQVLDLLSNNHPGKVDFQKRSYNPLLLEMGDKETRKFMGYCAVEKA